MSVCVHLTAEALDQWQRQAVFSNPGRAFVPPVEVGIILLVHFVEEMLFRAVILQGEPSCYISIPCISLWLVHCMAIMLLVVQCQASLPFCCVFCISMLD